MLHEIAITPDVFLPRGYNLPELCDAYTQNLRMALFEWCIVRDLRSGDWKKSIREHTNEMPYRTRELWKSLTKSNRLKSFAPILPEEPADDIQWCAEALEVHSLFPCLGILSSAATKRTFQQNSVVASIENMASAWWRSLESGHPEGPTSRRMLSDYQSRLKLLLNSSRSLMFIDPHLDPTKSNYSSFLEMIRPALIRSVPKPKIEIHRCCFEGSGRERRVVEASEWERRFRNQWQGILSSSGSQVEVFIWSDFHDRYLISDLLGVHIGNGFDTSNDVNARVTWSRLDSKARDDIQRRFDSRVEQAMLKHRFTI